MISLYLEVNGEQNLVWKQTFDVVEFIMYRKMGQFYNVPRLRHVKCMPISFEQ